MVLGLMVKIREPIAEERPNLPPRYESAGAPDEGPGAAVFRLNLHLPIQAG